MSPSPLLAAVILALAVGATADDPDVPVISDTTVIWVPVGASIGGIILLIAICCCICRLCCGCCRKETHVINTTVVQSTSAPPAPAPNVVVAPTIMTAVPQQHDPGFTNYAYGQQYPPSAMYHPVPQMTKEMPQPCAPTAPPPYYP